MQVGAPTGPPARAPPGANGWPRKSTDGTTKAQCGECAYVMLVYGAQCELYFLGAAMVAWSLIKHKCVHRRVLMYTRDVPDRVLKEAVASELFDELVETEYITANAVYFNNPASEIRFRHVFTKYQVFGLTQYEKVLLLDTDIYVRGNIDSLFELETPAAMNRGKDKPPHGSVMKQHSPVNAGVMLLKPDKNFLGMALELIGTSSRSLPSFNSPDAEFLTTFHLPGEWTSIGLEYNYQLEYQKLDPSSGTVQYSTKRSDHFSEKGASMKWDMLKVLHFSGHGKPWDFVLRESAFRLQRLVGEVPADPHRGDAAENPAVATQLHRKLVAGLAEYGREVAELQGLCSQLQIGKEIFWKEWRCGRRVRVAADRGAARKRIVPLMPKAGSWYNGPRPDTAVWVPPGDGQLVPGAPLERVSAAAVYLEIAAARPVVGPGSRVRARSGGAVHEYEVQKQMTLPSGGSQVVLHRKVSLSPQWQELHCPQSDAFYYHMKDTDRTQWEFPDLPDGWTALHNDSGEVYYHNKAGNYTSWHRPAEDVIERNVDDLEDIIEPKPDRRACEVSIWKRCFLNADSEAHIKVMEAALEKLRAFGV